MTGWPTEPDLRATHHATQALAQRLRLPFRSQTWRGQVGNWIGAGVGSSIDFQDHRPYQPGDDPRHIDWRAYGRTGHYIMKLYREEVTPLVDVALDLSDSMLFDDAKRTRTAELLYFSLESARQSDASLRLFAVRGPHWVPWELASILAYRPPVFADTATGAHEPPVLRNIPWRTGALRVFISDLLIAGSPEPLLQPLTGGKGRGLIFAPYCRAEASPDWAGDIEFVDCENGHRQIQHIESRLLRRYEDAYRRHHELWREHCQKRAVTLARVAAEQPLAATLQAEALPVGAVELWV